MPVEIPLRPKYLGRTAKKTQRKSGGNSGQSAAVRNPPVGIRKHPKRRKHSQ
jgi:hypothetical protein